MVYHTLVLTDEQVEVLFAALRGCSTDSLMTYANKDRATTMRIRASLDKALTHALAVEGATNA